MLYFPIQWDIIEEMRSERIDMNDRSRITFNVRLNDVWKLMFIYSRNVSGLLILISIKIHRKTTNEGYSIIGEFIRSYSSSTSIHMKFARILKAGSSVIAIYSSVNSEFYQQKDRVIGWVRIFDVREKDNPHLHHKRAKLAQFRSFVQLSKDMAQILDPKPPLFADVTLKCGGIPIAAHKVILSARSPVFAAMFANPMMESQTNEVEIIDIEKHALQCMIQYMYTGRLPSIADVSAATDLLFAADKYLVQGLKRGVNLFLKKCMSPENIWRIFVLGDMHSDELKTFAMDYICNKWGKDFTVLEATPEWKALREEKPTMVIEILEHMVKHKGKNINKK